MTTVDIAQRGNSVGGAVGVFSAGRCEDGIRRMATFAGNISEPSSHNAS